MEEDGKERIDEVNRAGRAVRNRDRGKRRKKE